MAAIRFRHAGSAGWCQALPHDGGAPKKTDFINEKTEPTHGARNPEPVVYKAHQRKHVDAQNYICATTRHPAARGGTQLRRRCCQNCCHFLRTRDGGIDLRRAA
jgi:hypothetical protein